jgi:histidinol-phosphatase (PHP family)
LSPGFKALFGYQDNEFPHNSSWWQENIFEEDLSAVLDNFNKHCEDPSHHYDQVVRYRHKDGSTVWVRCRGKVMFNDDGKPVRIIVAHTDLTDLMKAKEEMADLARELANSNASQLATFDAILDSIIIIDSKGVILDINQSTTRLFQYHRNEIIGQNVRILMDQDDAGEHDRHLSNYAKTKQAKIIGKGREVIAKKKSGQLFYAFLSIAEYKSSNDIHYVGTLRDISDQVKDRLSLKYDALHDSLTELASRRLLEQSIEESISESLREDLSFSILFIDLNKFKPINDNLGHDIGDEVLKIVAKRLANTVREKDLCARIGGDEFVILTEPTASNLDIELLEGKLKQIIEQPIVIGKHTLLVSASFGHGLFPNDGDCQEKLLRLADSRMYQDKRDYSYD